LRCLRGFVQLRIHIAGLENFAEFDGRIAGHAPNAPLFGALSALSFKEFQRDGIVHAVA
jgi:hypothetical protein